MISGQSYAIVSRITNVLIEASDHGTPYPTNQRHGNIDATVGMVPKGVRKGLEFVKKTLVD